MTEVAPFPRQIWLERAQRSTSTAVTRPTVLLTMLAIAVNERVLDYATPASLWHKVGVGALAWLASVWIPVLASRVLTEVRDTYRVAGMVTAYTLSATVFAVITFQGLAAPELVGHEEASLAGRMAGLVPSRIALWLGITYLVDASLRLQARRHALTAAHNDLRGLMAQATEHARHVPEDAAAEVRHALANEVAALRTTSTPEVVGRLHSTIEDVVRPMSQRLAGQVPMWTPVPQSAPSQQERNSLRQFVGLLVPYRDLRPSVIAVSYATLMLVSSIVNLGIKEGAMTVLRVAVLVFVVAELLRFTALRNPVAAPLRLALQLAGSAIVIGGAAATTVLMAADSRGHAERLALETGATVVLVTIALGMAAIGTRLFQRTDDLLAVTNEQIAWRIARLRGQHWVAQQGLAMKLHGTVQSTMQACLHRLRTAQSDSQRASVFVDLETSLDQLLAAPDQTPPLADQLGDIVDTWRGIADVRIHAATSDIELIDDDSICSSVVQSIVQDSVSNAVRHGGSTSIDVAIACGDVVVNLVITSDGQLPSLPNRPGFGTAQLEACAVTWLRDLDSTPRRLQAVIPLVQRHVSTHHDQTIEQQVGDGEVVLSAPR